MAANYTEKHYLTSAVTFGFFGQKAGVFATIDKHLPFKFIHYISPSTVPISAAITHLSSDPISFDKPFLKLWQAWSQSYELGKLSDHDQQWYRDPINQFWAAKTATTIVSTGLGLTLWPHIIKSINLQVSGFSKLNQYSEQEWTSYKSNFATLGLQFFGALLLENALIEYPVNHYVMKPAMRETAKRAVKVLLNDQISMKILGEAGQEKGDRLIKKFIKDHIITLEQSGEIGSLIRKIVLGSDCVKIILDKSPAILMTNIIYETVIGQINAHINKGLLENNEKLTELESSRDKMTSHFLKEIKTLTERGGEQYTLGKLNGYNVEISKVSSSAYWLKTFDNVITYNKNDIGAVINVFAIAWSVRKNYIDQDAALTFFYNVKRGLELLNFDIEFDKAHANLYLTMDRLKEIHNIIGRHIVDYGQIHTTSNVENKLIIRNFTLSFGTEKLVALDDMSMEMGKHYAVTGAKGSGKSSLFSKVAGLKYTAFNATGEISYPLINGEKAFITMITQKDYIPPRSTLAEILFFPRTLPGDNTERKNIIDFMKTLLREIKIDPNMKDGEDSSSIVDIEQVGEWGDRLSGGQKKSVAIISAVMSKGDIIIFDETFAGLDKDSLKIAQHMMNKYMFGKMIVVVDHEAQHHNDTGFFDVNWHFADKTVTAQQFTGTTTDHSEGLPWTDVTICAWPSAH
jgi:energy-coupling factor transporter ATP-binding protein EcfA2